MFIGHYGVSFAAKAAHKPLPLWLLFISVQFLDVVWSVLVMLGIEKLRITPGISKANSLDLYYMPYTHSLGGALVLSAALGGASAVFFRHNRVRVFWIVAAAVFSHWLLDLIVHVPDMPLIGDTAKVGFGLWNYPAISLPLELATLWVGAWICGRSEPAGTALGNIALWTFVALLTLIELYTAFGPAPASPLDEAHTALAAYLALAAVAGLVDLARRPRRARPGAGFEDSPLALSSKAD